MKFFFVGVAFIFFWNIWKNRGAVRLLWFFMGAIFFQERIILLEYPTVVSFHRFLILSLLFAEIYYPRSLYVDIKTFPLTKPLLILLGCVLCVGIFDSRHNIFLGAYRSIDDYIQSFLILFLCYGCFKEVADWEKILKAMLNIGIVLSLYGIYNFFIKSNPIDAFISKVYGSVSSFDVYLLTQERFRVNSFVSHPIFYGYLSGLLLLIAVYCYCFMKNLQILSIVVVPLLLTGLALSNSRTPMLSTAIGLLVFLVIALKPITMVRVFFIGILMFIAVYRIPFFKESIRNTLSLFSANVSEPTGSSLRMREDQLYASFGEFRKSPVFGNGLYYINENLGWDPDPEKRVRDEEFQGFESYIYHLLIEQGIVGIAGNLFFFISLFLYFIRRIHQFGESAALGVAIVVMFLVYIIGTGTVNSWIISFGILGVLIKYLEIQSANLSAPKEHSIAYRT